MSATHGAPREVTTPHRKISLEIPDGDVLIHAGDLTNRGILEEVSEFNTFLGTLPHPHKIW